MRILGQLLFLVLFIVSCKNENFSKLKETKDKIGNAVNAVDNITSYNRNMENVEERISVLAKMTPIQTDQLKSWMPDEVDGMQRSNYSIQKMPMTMIELDFKSPNTDQKVSVSIIDCAGQDGSTLYATQGMFSGLYLGMESENETEVQEIKERNGIKSYEVYNKEYNDSTINTTIAERFVVTLEAENMTTDEAYDFLKKLNIDDLG